jgi:hypothetical protein
MRIAGFARATTVWWTTWQWSWFYLSCSLFPPPSIVPPLHHLYVPASEVCASPKQAACYCVFMVWRRTGGATSLRGALFVTQHLVYVIKRRLSQRCCGRLRGCHWVRGSRRFEGTWCLHLQGSNMKVLRSFETSGHTLEYLNPIHNWTPPPPPITVRLRLLG